MNTVQINEILENDKISKNDFIGVYSRDKIPKFTKMDFPCSLVVNTDTSKQPGTHWLAVYYDKNGNCYFFDSMAFSPQFYNLDNVLLKHAKSLVYSTFPIQSYYSDFCGLYCVLFILFKSRDYSLDNFLNFFDENTLKNDRKILYLISKF
jgi:hypothetical protein